MFGSSSPSNFFQVSLNNTHEQTCTQTYTNTPVGTLYIHTLFYTDTHIEHIRKTYVQGIKSQQTLTFLF